MLPNRPRRETTMPNHRGVCLALLAVASISSAAAAESGLTPELFFERLQLGASHRLHFGPEFVNRLPILVCIVFLAAGGLRAVVPLE